MSPAPSAAARAADRLPSRWNAASAQPTPMAGTTEQRAPAAGGARGGREGAAGPREPREPPAAPQGGDQPRPPPDPPPQQAPDPLAPAPRDRKAEQREAEEQPHDQRADPEQLPARLRVHVMRRSAYTGTTPNRSAWALKATSPARSASVSWRPASECSSASTQVVNCCVSARAAVAASFRASLRSPLRMALMSRPAA